GESIQWLHAFQSNFSSLRRPGHLSDGRFDAADAKALLGIVAASEWQVFRLQLERDWMRQFVEGCAKMGHTLKDMGAKRAEVVKSYRIWKKDAEAQETRWLQQALDSACAARLLEL